jgi:hypothetical protein
MNKLWKTGKGTAILVLRASRNPPGLNAESFNPSCVKQTGNGGTLANRPRCINPFFGVKHRFCLRISVKGMSID